jgi:hypothetical protein
VIPNLATQPRGEKTSIRLKAATRQLPSDPPGNYHQNVVPPVDDYHQNLTPGPKSRNSSLSVHLQIEISSETDPEFVQNTPRNHS